MNVNSVIPKVKEACNLLNQMRPAPDAASLHQALHKLLEEIGTGLEEGSMSYGPTDNGSLPIDDDFPF